MHIAKGFGSTASRAAVCELIADEHVGDQEMLGYRPAQSLREEMCKLFGRGLQRVEARRQHSHKRQDVSAVVASSYFMMRGLQNAGINGSGM